MFNRRGRQALSSWGNISSWVIESHREKKKVFCSVCLRSVLPAFDFRLSPKPTVAWSWNVFPSELQSPAHPVRANNPYWQTTTYGAHRQHNYHHQFFSILSSVWVFCLWHHLIPREDCYPVLAKGSCQKRFSGFYPLRGYPPPLPH